MGLITLQGPWRGMDLRDGEVPPGSYAIGFNIDTSDGNIAARPPLGVRASSVAARARLHLVDRAGIDGRIIAAGPVTLASTAAIIVTFYDASTLSSIGGGSVLSTFGEPPNGRGWTCSFVDVFLKPSTTGVPRPATLLVTPHTTYVYEPHADPTHVRAVSIATDSQQINGSNFSYWAHAPKGPIAVTHQTRVYYAGFLETDEAWLDNPLETDQTAIPEAVVGTGRGHLSLSPSVFVWSDEYDPVGIRADHYAATDAHEPIRGLHSTGEVLLVFTSRSIYAWSGYSDATYTLSRLTSAPGCVAHASIVTVDGVTYYAAADGIYAFGGMGAPQAVKVSDPIDALWNGLTADNLPVSLRSGTGAEVWSNLRVDRSQGHLTVGKHYPERNQIWWSIPAPPIGSGGVAIKWPRGSLPLTIVLNTVTQGWNIYFCVGTSAGTETPMGDAVNPAGRWVTSSARGKLQELGYGLWDGVAEGDAAGFRGVHACWLSRRIPETGPAVTSVKGLYFRQLATGTNTTAQDPAATIGQNSVPTDVTMWALEGDSSAFDFETDAAVAVTDYRDIKSRNGTLRCHPRDVSASFVGSLVFGTGKFGSRDWFTAKGDVEMTARWFQVGLMDNPYSGGSARASRLCVSSIGVETVGSTGSPKG